MKSLYLIDGMAVLFRGYYALLNAHLTAKDGEPTGATFAFISTLERLLEQEKPDLIAVAWDSAEPTFRHDEYAEYKANRIEFPEELIPQLQRVKELVGYYHIPCLQLPGYEADDIIGTMARRAEAEGYRVYCVTPDKDFLQLVTENILVLRPSKPGQPNDIVDVDGVQERFGVTPAQVIDVLALMGDSSDNVPGVRGIGEKTAIPLVQEFGSVEGIYENLESISRKGTRTKLEENHDMALLSKRLVTIDTNVPIDVPFESLHLDPPDIPSLLRNFDRLGFTSLVKRYDTEVQSSGEAASPTDAAGSEAGSTTVTETAEADPDRLHTIETGDTRYLLLDTVELVDEALAGPLSGVEVVAFDLETDSTDEMRASIIGISLAARANEAFYIPVRAEVVSTGVGDAGDTLFDQPSEPVRRVSEGLDLPVVLAKISPLLTDPAVAKVGQNAKFDMIILRRHGIEVEPLAFDTMLAAYVLDSTQAVGMDALARKYLSYSPVPITALIGPKGKDQKTLLDVPVCDVSDYACEDADITFRLYEHLGRELEEENLAEVARTYEFPLVPVLTRMESTGIRVDRGALEDISAQLGEVIASLEAEIYELAGHPFTINSPKQLGSVLFEELELPAKKKTKTGYSTDQFVLEDLAALHPLPERILEYRSASKLKSTYVDALPALINEETGRIHTSYNQAVTSTGRLSSNNPNLQNIPIRSEVGREIRKAFIPGFDGGLLVAADYSQIELRIMAHICGDPTMVEAFATGFDIHTATAMRVFGVEQDAVEPNMRRKAKEVNFGIMYGIGPFGLARRLKISNDEARNLITTYFENYPGVREYINGTLQKLRTDGYVETLSGRRRFYGNPDKLRNPQRGMVERAAINMPIQGTAADIIKLAMINIHRDLPEAFPKANMLLQVHDELVFEVPAAQAEELAEWVCGNMEAAFPLGNVRLEAETGIGQNWFEAH